MKSTQKKRPAVARKVEPIVQFPDGFFSAENGVQSNGCYLVENCDAAPYVRPVSGWKIVGYGKAPWPGSTDGFAVVLEKVTPESDHVTHRGEEYPEGTRMWQHYCERWIEKLNPAVEGRREPTTDPKKV